MAPRVRRTTVSVLAVLACVPVLAQERPDVGREIEKRAGHPIAPAPRTLQSRIPPGVDLGNGLSEDEAVALALWNNPALEVDLAALGFARADLVEAGLLRNPVLSLLFPLGPKQLELTATWPLEALWQRPRRVAAARADLRAVAEHLVQHGLDLARDVRVAFADYHEAADRVRFMEETARVRGRMSELASARLRAGEISALEEGAVRIEAERANQEAARLSHAVYAAAEHLRALVGFAEDPVEIRPVAPAAPDLSAPPDAAALVRTALASRPDLRAAEIEVEAAALREGWERSKVFTLSAILDVNGEGKEGFEIGPGLLAEIPLLNRNAGGRARARAQMEKAALGYLAVRQRIVLEVRQASSRLSQASEDYRRWRDSTVPLLEAALLRTEKAYRAGAIGYYEALEPARGLSDARLRQAEALAGVRRAVANLDRSVGRARAGNP